MRNRLPWCAVPLEFDDDQGAILIDAEKIEPANARYVTLASKTNTPSAITSGLAAIQSSNSASLWL